MFGLECWAVVLLLRSRSGWGGWVVALCSLMCLVRLGVSLHREDMEREHDERHYFQHNSVIVPQKHLDTLHLLGYNNYMEKRTEHG
jgi:hypothetical protein